MTTPRMLWPHAASRVLIRHGASTRRIAFYTTAICLLAVALVL